MTHRASDVMDAAPLTVGPELAVTGLATLLLERGADGACVVADGALIGVVTTMDLIFQSRPPHMPSFFHFLEALIPLENLNKVEHDLKKLSGATVADIMTPTVLSAAPEQPLTAVADLMVTRHLSIVPVVDAAGHLLGAVTKAGILRRAYGLT
jgi:CBS domain-containing protein